MSIARRRALACLLVLALPVSSCVVNPVSGRPELSVTSPAEEKEIGKQGAEQVEGEMGLVQDERITSYVSSLGQRIASQSPRKDVSYRFRVVDVPEPNAFSLPGGYIYVSRGILALVNEEDELAGVLGHEIAHVAARHAAQRQTRALGVGLLALPGLLAGSLIGGPLGDVVAAPFAIGWAGALASYSRDQEREADRVGQEMVARAGYDPDGLSRFLATLERYERLETGERRRASFFDTHPLTPDRARLTAEHARELAWQPSPELLPRPAFLRRIEGVLVGENPARGVFEGTRFLHPDLDFSIRFPEGWETGNAPQVVGAVQQKREAQIVLEIQGRGEDPRAAGEALLAELGKSVRYRRVEVLGMDVAGGSAFRARILAPSRGGDVGIDFTWIAHRGLIFRLAGTTRAPRFQDYRAIFGETASSFRPLDAADRAAIREERLRIALARRDETLAALEARTGSAWSQPQIAVANELAESARLASGQLVKVAVPERYE